MVTERVMCSNRILNNLKPSGGYLIGWTENGQKLHTPKVCLPLNVCEACLYSTYQECMMMLLYC